MQRRPRHQFTRHTWRPELIVPSVFFSSYVSDPMEMKKAGWCRDVVSNLFSQSLPLLYARSLSCATSGAFGLLFSGAAAKRNEN